MSTRKFEAWEKIVIISKMSTKNIFKRNITVNTKNVHVDHIGVYRDALSLNWGVYKIYLENMRFQCCPGVCFSDQILTSGVPGSV